MNVIRARDGSFVSAKIRRPSNFHAHLRQGELMRAIGKHIMRYVLYLLIMPNTGPIRTMEDALRYYDALMRIAQEEGLDKLHLLMTLYHTEDVTPAVIEQIAQSAVVYAMKHYPPAPGLTTGSGLGIPLEESYDTLRAMEDCGVPLLAHCEDPTPNPLDGEATAIREHMWRLRDRHPRLKICVEHVSTIEGIEFAKSDTSGRTVVTITPHHPNFNNHDVEEHGGTFKCKTPINTPENQAAVFEFMVSGDPRAIAGDDTAAHLSATKLIELSKAANGCFFAEQSIPFYASAFLKADAMDQRFEDFMSLNGPRWWGLPEPAEDDTITIVASNDDLPEPIEVPEANDVVIPFGWDPDPAKRVHVGLAVQAA